MNLKIKICLFLFAFFLLFFLFKGYFLQRELILIYERGESVKIFDREGKEIAILPNERGYFARYSKEIPKNFKKFLIKKEDRYFYFHFGFNPWSTFQAFLNRMGLSSRKASSTISQQLVKILLEKEKERNWKNKIIELFYALALETYQPKEKILEMYVNSVYFGNQTQGIKEASFLYFGLDPEMLSKGQILQLLATISNPSGKNPAQISNEKEAKTLAKKMKLDENLVTDDYLKIRERMKNYPRFSTKSYFEISSFLKKDLKVHRLTIDQELSDKLREIVKRNIEELKEKKAKNAALIVIKLPENEILALIGSPDPTFFENGYQINMLKKPRAVGSTIKPFIYLKAFEKGLRPYTLVEDREYKYLTAGGFPFYPQNFDKEYHGEVTLHYALSNSLNIPTIKVLEYLGLENFYRFLKKDLNFQTVQNLENYQLGIALGTLEIDLLTLAKYFTIFPQNGILKELKIYQQDNFPEKLISSAEYIQLINKILSDRYRAIDQFGLKSDLNLSQKNYALKTGTSSAFKDSWIFGYTPDFLVGVWVGNADNSSMEKISGQLGAGRIWAQTMELLFNSKYNKKNDFNFDLIEEFKEGKNIEYGLKGDLFEKNKNILKENNNSLILNPHNEDIYLLEEGTKIFLKSREKVFWFINDIFWGKGEKVVFSPKFAGEYKIRAEKEKNFKEEIVIYLLKDL